MRHRWQSNLQHEVSWFLVAYLLALLSFLMLVHLLQPERDGSASSSRSPGHQGRQKTPTQAEPAQPGADRAQVDRRSHAGTDNM